MYELCIFTVTSYTVYIHSNSKHIKQQFILTQDQKGGRSSSSSFIIIGNDDITLEAPAVLHLDLC